MLAAIIPSLTAVGHIGFLPVISPAPYTFSTLVLPFSSIINPNLSNSILLPSKNAVFDLTPVATTTNSQGISSIPSPVFTTRAFGLLFSSKINFSALTPRFKLTPCSSNLFL